MLLRLFFAVLVAIFILPLPLYAATDADTGKIAEGVSVLSYTALIVAAAILIGSVVRTYGERPSPVGRYQHGMGSGGQDRVLDTRTGRLWERALGSVEWVEVTGPWSKRA